jgi:hypothetical protein
MSPLRLSILIVCCCVPYATANAQAEPRKSFADLACDIETTLKPAENNDCPTQWIYERIRTLEGLQANEVSKASTAGLLKKLDEEGDKSTASMLRKNGGADNDPTPDSENYESERQSLLRTLELRGAGAVANRYAAAPGVQHLPYTADALAAFYTALLSVEAAKRVGPSNERDRLYGNAVAFWKRSGDAGDAGAYWNLAVMYQSGEGVLRSNLAAIEWFYKAGTGFLRLHEREKALAALEAIQSIDRKSALAHKLEGLLAGGAPK